ncbi:Dolichol-phosphate mannosyltransferase subunit 3, partial [Fragariocoptes setiger]
MKRFVKFVIRLIPFIMVWIAYWIVFTERQKLDARLQNFVVIIVPCLTIGYILLLGLWAIGTVAYRVAVFNDCEEARKELLSEIQEARADLKKKGIIK